MGKLKPKGLVRRILSPLIAVVSSPELNALCVENNIPSFLELIRPFGVEIEGKVTIRDSKGQPKTHSNSTVRFAALNKIEPASLYSEDALLSRNISDLIKNQARSTDGLKAEILESIPLATKNENEYSEEIPAPLKSTDKFYKILSQDLDDSTPWFSLYRNAFLNQLRLAEHETFDHPVACIVATSTSNAQPVETLARLYEQYSQLNQLQYVSPDIFQYYVLVHDVRSGNMESAITLFEQVKKTLGIHCQLLLINSRSSKTEGQANSIVPDVWGHVIDVSQPGKFERRDSRVSELAFLSNDSETSLNSRAPGECGSLLSLEDFESLKNLIKKMFGESLLPHMERCMHLWNEQVASSRRGFTGRLFSASKRYFSSGRSQVMSGGNSAASSGSSLNLNSTVGSVYIHTTPEAQLRKLADYAFMLRDYDFARSTYETVKKDFQADGAWRFYAGAQEMTGLCLLFSENSGARIDVERYYDKAIRHYTANKMTTWAARCVLLYHTMLKHHHRYGDIPPLLSRLTSDESDLRSALLLEQAAHGYLRVSRVRKFGFHLILAGHRYNKCNQREHAYYCYQLAAKVFGVAPAAEASSQDSWLMTRPKKRWGLMEDHISFSLGRQSFHLGELRQAIAHFSWLLHDSQQPTAVQAGYMKEFMYIYKNHFTSTGHEILLEPSTSLPVPVLSSVKIQVPTATSSWEGESSLSDDSSPVWTRLSAGVDIPPSGIISEAQPQLHICPLQESFQVSLEIHNPLAIPLALSAMTLDYAYEGTGSIHATSAPDQVLEAHQSSTLTFVVTPQNEGLLNLKGLTLTINEHARTYKSFARRGPRLNDTPMQRQTCIYGPSYHCTLRVVTALPKLALQLDGLPDTIYSGEVVSGRLQLRNVGSSALTKLDVSLTHPTFLTFGRSTSQAQAQGTVSINNNITDFSSASVEFYPSSEPYHSGTLPLECLDPGQVAQVPIHIRGDRVGIHRIYLLFRYQTAQDKKGSVQCRVARLLCKLEVLPSLKINAFTRPSVKDLGNFIVGIEVENVQPLSSFRITQLSSLSHKWQISPIVSQTPPQKLTLIPGTSTSLYFKVAPTVTPKDINWDSTEAHLATVLQNLTRGSKLSADYPPLTLTFSNISLTNNLQGIWDFPCKSLYVASRTQNRLNWLSKDMAILAPERAKATFPLLHPSDIDLSLFWEIVGKDGQVRGGHHFIIGITFNLAQNPLLDHIPSSNSSHQDDSKLTRSLFEGTAQEKIQIIRHLVNYPRFTNESPVRAIIQTPDAIHLSFANGPVEIPVLFLLKNFSWNRSADFTLSLLSAATSQATGHTASKASSASNIPHPQDFDSPHFTADVCKRNAGFWWEGPNHHSKKSLEPGTEHQIHVKVVVAAPGTYDLNMWQLKVTSHTFLSGYEEGHRAYRSYLASALGQPILESPSTTHTVSPPLPHLLHVFDNRAT
ncbi:hypothetical protein DSO57_1003145 [Entomophthora muscae]|uniref:Uncharacterized protein n=1 Tax=Entomophthora muscae TaxID=34485 RepID=A0ACC2RNH5_9FUNG|nr:hypothetical protein DSO57_1003145 [Entomophthora muscae]